MYQNVKHTCRAVALLIKTYCFVTFSLPSPSPSRFRKVPNNELAADSTPVVSLLRLTIEREW